MKNAIFANRQEAMQKLADVLMVRNLDFSQSVLLATSLDGAYFADELAKILKIPLEYLFTQTLCAPLNPECQIAIVSEELDIVMHENLIDTFGISLDYIYGEAKRQYEESIIPTRYQYRKGELLSSLRGQDVLIVDQGIDTGLTVMCAIKTCVNLNAKSIRVATPILPTSVYESLNEVCDEVLCVQSVEHFVNVEHYYKELQPLESKVIEEILDKHLSYKRKDTNDES